jgi:hypothetical protein
VYCNATQLPWHRPQLSIILAHEKLFARAFESLGVDWVRPFASKTYSSKMTDVRRLEEMNLHDQQWFFSNEESGLAEIFTGASPHLAMDNWKHWMDCLKESIFLKVPKHHKTVEY